MLKKLLIVLLLFAAVPALAEDEYWTKKADLYYHAVQLCGGTEDRVPVSAEAAAEFKKVPCPVCVQEEDDGAAVRGVVRGGTLVVCFSDEWLSKPEVTGVFVGIDVIRRTGAEADAWLAEHLHGDRYAAFLDAYAKNGYAETAARSPVILRRDGELIMNTRHIGSRWYVTVRPDTAPKKSWEMYWRINEEDVRMRDGTLETAFARQTLEEYTDLKLQQAQNAKSVFEQSYDTLQLTVYREMDANIAVIYEPGANADFLDNVVLTIGGRHITELFGYMDGDMGIYCCVLGDAELDALRGGTEAALWRRPLTEDVEFSEYGYAAVRNGSGGIGIMNREGEFVVPPDYSNAHSISLDSYNVKAVSPFFCYDADGNLSVRRGDTLEIIAHYDVTDRYLMAGYLNPSVFRLNTGQGMLFCSLENGAILFEVPYDENRNYADSISDVEGVYAYYAEGFPQRLVIEKGADMDVSALLVDNSGNTVAEGYQRITPLIWKGDTGVFLTERFVPTEWRSFGYVSRDEIYTGGGCGGSWCCGLIDQDGNILADMKYKSVEFLSEHQIRLGTLDGGFEVIEV